MLPDGTTLAVGQHTGDENIASALEVLNTRTASAATSPS
jgi:hypothetical protein